MRRIVLADAPWGAIVRYQGDWGVLCMASNDDGKNGKRVIDFWDGGRCYVPNYAVVEVAA